MLMIRNTPADAYRRVTIDARIKGAGPGDLAKICFEQLALELGRAVRAHECGDVGRRSDGLTRAIAALTALEMGLDRSNPIAGAMEQLYGAAREAMLSSVTRFDTDSLIEVRNDFAEIGQAFAAPDAGAKLLTH